MHLLLHFHEQAVARFGRHLLIFNRSVAIRRRVPDKSVWTDAFEALVLKGNVLSSFGRWVLMQEFVLIVPSFWLICWTFICLMWELCRTRKLILNLYSFVLRRLWQLAEFELLARHFQNWLPPHKLVLLKLLRHRQRRVASLSQFQQRCWVSMRPLKSFQILFFSFYEHFIFDFGF